MRRWWKALGLLAGGLASLGGIATSASAQFPPPPGGGMGMPPGMMGMPPGGMGMPPGMMGMPPGGFGMPPGSVPGMPTSAGDPGMPPGAFGGNPTLTGKPPEFPNPGQPSQEPVSPFSIKDDGMPNAFSDLIDPRLLRPVHWQLSAGYTFLWFRPGHYPPLATTGNILDPVPGGLGQPGTSIISGPREPGPSAVFRVTASYWLVDPEVLSIDGNFFVMEQRSVTQQFVSDVNGFPVLTRPFFNTAAQAEDADPRSLPNVLKGGMFDSVTTRLMGSEMYLKWQSAPQSEGARVNLTLGLRWLRLDERYQSFDTTRDVTDTIFAATISDTFTTYNQFFGGQVGLEWQYRLSRFTFALGGKIAVGPNYQTLKINGETALTDLTTFTTSTDRQGLYAQPSNIGNYHSIRTAVVSEASASLGFDLSDRIRFNIGYTFLLFSNALRPGDQMDRGINIQPLLAGGGSAPASPAPPIFQQTTFTGHMLNLGLEFLF